MAQTFLTLTTRLGSSGAFYLYACVAAAGFAWAAAVLPETNGLTLDQVQQLFGGGGGGEGSGGGGSSGGGGLLWGAQRKRRASDDEAEGPA